jgi:hypothetical protein
MREGRVSEFHAFASLATASSAAAHPHRTWHEGLVRMVGQRGGACVDDAVDDRLDDAGRKRAAKALPRSRAAQAGKAFVARRLVDELAARETLLGSNSVNQT